MAHSDISKDEIKNEGVEKMEYIIMVLFGIFIGVAVAGYMFVNEINRKDRIARGYRQTIRNQNRLIKEYQEKNIILLKKSAELKSKIIDLENNIELLRNSLPEKNKDELEKCKFSNSSISISDDGILIKSQK